MSTPTHWAILTVAGQSWQPRETCGEICGCQSKIIFQDHTMANLELCLKDSLQQNSESVRNSGPICHSDNAATTPCVQTNQLVYNIKWYRTHLQCHKRAPQMVDMTWWHVTACPFFVALRFTRHSSHSVTWIKIYLTQADSDCDQDFIRPILHSVGCNEHAELLSVFSFHWDSFFSRK